MRPIYILAALAVVSVSPAFACSNDNPNRFERVDEQSVLDIQTELTWHRCLAGTEVLDGECSGVPEYLSWNDAAAFAANRAGEWRMPTLEEMETIIDDECQMIVLPDVFPMPEGVEIWTASPGFPVNDVSAIIDLTDGKIWGIGRGVSRNFMLVSGSRTD